MRLHDFLNYRAREHGEKILAKQPEATAYTLRDGRMHTGDAGFLDDEGYLYIQDRIKDVIVSGGENVYPRMVEEVLYQHPAVAEAAVIGVPDKRWGETVKAIIILRQGMVATVEEIMDFCRDKMGGFERPCSVDFVDELPRTPSGKVLKRILREPYWADQPRRVAGVLGDLGSNRHPWSKRIRLTHVRGFSKSSCHEREGADMKISQMHITPIAVSDPPLLNAAGLHAPYALRTIVELVTDDDVYGLGEIPGDATTTAALEAAREFVVGHDPFHLTALTSTLDQRFDRDAVDMRGDAPWDSRHLVHVKSAIEVACLDIVGKAIGRPVVDLLGGAVRDRIHFSGYLFYKSRGAGGELAFDVDPEASGWAAARQAEALSPEAIVAQAQAMCAEFGFQSLKLKAGVLDPEIEVNTIVALRDTFGPEVPLRIDPNGVWSLPTAIKWGKRLEGTLEYYEDPTRGQENMARVKEAVNIPLATNMFTTSFDDLPSSIALGAEDIILSDHHFWGGLRPCQDLAAICRTFGRGLSMHSNSHVGISLVAMTHLAAAIPNLTYDLDTHYPWQSEEVIIGGRMQFERGSLPVPTAPGLGVELDRQALARLHQNYLACGLKRRDDEVEMQKIQPGWRFRSVRW